MDSGLDPEPIDRGMKIPEFIITTTVRIDQLECSSRETLAQYRARRPASPSLVPYCTLKSLSGFCRGHWNPLETGAPSARAIISGGAPYREPKNRVNARRPAPLAQPWISDSFRVVVYFLSVFGGANRPEFRILDLYVPWIFVISLFGFLAAWLVIAILESTGLSRHIWHLPLFFLALVVLLSSIFGFVCFP